MAEDIPFGFAPSSPQQAKDAVSALRRMRPDWARQIAQYVAPGLYNYTTESEPSYDSRLQAAGGGIGPQGQLVPPASGKVPSTDDPRTGPALYDAFNLMTAALPTGAGSKAALIAAPMAGKLARAAAGIETAAPKGIRAYHGSPHDFERFDLSKIGTGEGAQSYGHGLYFAENEGVARSYRDTLARADKQWFVDGEAVGTYGQNSGPLGGAAARLRQIMGRDGVATEADADAALKALEQVNKNNPGMIPKAHFDEVSRAIPQLVGRKVSESAPGRMYEVNINARPEQFLDWDKPLAQQPELLGSMRSRKEAFTASPIERARQVLEADRPQWTGQDFQNRLALDLMHGTSGRGGEILASERLREAGIPGIKYLDQGSRFTTSLDDLKSKLADVRGKLGSAPTVSAADRNALDALKFRERELRRQIEDYQAPTSNFVLFDDKIVDILRKYGLAGAMAPPAVAAATSQPFGRFAPE